MDKELLEIADQYEGNLLNYFVGMSPKQSKKFNKIFICEDGQHPILLKSYLAKKITIETMVILEKLVEYVKDFDKNIDENIV